MLERPPRLCEFAILQDIDRPSMHECMQGAHKVCAILCGFPRPQNGDRPSVFDFQVPMGSISLDSSLNGSTGPFSEFQHTLLGLVEACCGCRGLFSTCLDACKHGLAVPLNGDGD